MTGDNIADAYYDTTLDVTWYGVADSFFANVNDARDWVSNLTVGNASNWRLPHLLPRNGVAYDYDLSYDGSTDRGWSTPGTGWGTASEMGHLFYVTLMNQGSLIANAQNTGGIPNPLWDPQAQDTGGLNWVAGDAMYFAEETYSSSSSAIVYPWGFSFRHGLQNVFDEGPQGYAMAVHDGDVGNFVPGGGNTVPEPASLLLAAAALLGLSVRRKGVAPR